MDGVGDVGVDVQRRGARGPVARALLPTDRPPGERDAAKAELPGALLGQVHRGMPPQQHVPDDFGRHVGERMQRVGLAVPEGVPVIAAAGQPLGRDRPPLGSCPRLDDLEQREPDRLLERGIPVELDVGAGPDGVQVVALLRQQTLPAGAHGRGECRIDLITQRVQRPLAGPAVGQHLHHAEPLSRLQTSAHGDPGQVGLAVRGGHRFRRSVHDVVHAGRHPQPAGLRAVHQVGLQLGVGVLLGHEGGAQRRGRARVVAVALHERLVRDELGLDHDAGPISQRLDLVADRGHRALREGHQAGRADVDTLSCG